MKSTVLIFWTMLALAAGGSYAGWVVFHNWHANAAYAAGGDSASDEDQGVRMNIPPSKTIPGFTLTDQSGREFDSRKMMGKVWVASYFFASCPGPCYKLNQALAGLQADSDLDDVQFVSITCDPTNDTPEALRNYSARFAANPKRWFFLTGDEEKIQKIGMENFVVPVAAKTHSDFAVAMDRQSRVCGLFHLSDQAEVVKLQAKLRRLLAEKAPPAETAAEKPASALKTDAQP